MEDHANLEARLNAAAHHLIYPPTPPLRRWTSLRPAHRSLTARVAAGIAVLLVLSLAVVPPVRAAVLEFIQVGVVRIFAGEAAPPPIAITATPLPSLRLVLGRTSLDEAIATAGIPFRLPALLGPPDEVYLQDAGGPILFLVWAADGAAEASLTVLGPGVNAWKPAPGPVAETRVDGKLAIWVEGPHPLFLQTENDWHVDPLLFQAGSVLIWEQDALTYRLEGEFSLEEAVRIAESLTRVGP